MAAPRRVPDSARIGDLLFLLDTAFDRPSWHGPNLRAALRGVTPAVAVWRPQPGAHNVWELLVHAAYWKYAARRRLVGDARGSFPLHGSNWLGRPAADGSRTWRQDLALLDDMHQALRAAVAGYPPDRLDRGLRGSRVTARALIAGVAAHDVYHAGQIRLVRRLAARASISRA